MQGQCLRVRLRAHAESTRELALQFRAAHPKFYRETLEPRRLNFDEPAGIVQ
jgi:hypothetical protein